MKLKVVASSEPWYAKGLSFTCTCCGNCCTGPPGFVWMSEDEVGLLARHLGLSREETIETYCRRVGKAFSLKERRTPQGNYDCIFLTELPAEKKAGKVTQPRRVCGIYAVRPLQCRTWPFWEGNLISDGSWNEAAKRCPGMNRGKHYDKDEIEALRDAKQWPRSAPTSDSSRGRRRGGG